MKGSTPATSFCNGGSKSNQGRPVDHCMIGWRRSLQALLEALRLLAAGDAARIPQDNTQATYAPKLKREHGQINWSESAEAIERKIRAFNPWPGAFMKLNDQ